MVEDGLSEFDDLFMYDEVFTEDALVRSLHLGQQIGQIGLIHL